jgi:hypothetical protein
VGRAFDAQGNLRNWRSAADVAAFEKRTTCFADQYSQYIVPGDIHINGRLTPGENTADNGGLRSRSSRTWLDPARPRRLSWTASRRHRGDSSASPSSGARIRARKSNASRPQPTRARRTVTA